MSRVKKKWLFHQDQVIFISIQNKEVNEGHIGFSSDVYIFYDFLYEYQKVRGAFQIQEN